MGGLIGGLIGGGGGDATGIDKTSVFHGMFADSLPPGVSFTRASIATFIKNGAYTEVASGVSRHNGFGIVIEESRTNTATQSTGESHGNCTVTTGQIDPKGTLTALLCTVAAGTFSQFISPCAASNATATNKYASSCFVKAYGSTRYIQFLGSATAFAGYVNFDLQTGTVTKYSGTTDAEIEALNDGWFRVSFSWTAVGAATVTSLKIIKTGQETRGATCTYDGTEGLYTFGLQQELGYGATTYIPTTTEAVTRAADVVWSTDTSWISAFRDMTWFAKFMTKTSQDTAATSEQTIVCGDDGTANNVISISRDKTTAAIKATVTSSGVVQANKLDLFANAEGVPAKAAIAYADNRVAVSVDGGTVQYDTSATIPAITRVYFGSVGGSSGFLNGVLMSFSAFDPYAELKKITGSRSANNNSFPPSLVGRSTGVVGGDSITQGLNGSPYYVQVLGTKLGITMTNKGVSGSPLQNSIMDATGIPHGFNLRDRYVADLTGANKKDIVFILIGTNDMGYTLESHFSLANFTNDYQEMLTGLLAAGYANTDILIGSPPYVLNYNYNAQFTGADVARHELYVAAVKQLAADNNVLYAPVYEMTKAASPTSTDYADGLHPGTRIHAVIADAFMRASLV